MNDIKTITESITVAFQKYDTPVGPLFVAKRYGRIKKCFSRDTAIRHLAFFMTTMVFERSGIQQRHPDEKVSAPGVPHEMWRKGESTDEYLAAHQRCVRRLRRLLDLQRAKAGWRKKWESMHDRYAKEVAALQSCRPEGVL